MTTQERAELAVARKHSGSNCCQAVLAACEDLLPEDPAAIRAAASGFAVGMGTMEATCGALIGAVMAAGLLMEGQGTLPIAKRLQRDFEARSGAALCWQLKGRDTGRVLCPCDDCVRNAVYALMEALEA